MSYKILASNRFDKEIKRLSKKFTSLKLDLRELVFSLKDNPEQGIPLGNNCYKIRMAIKSKGKGKSGGARVITCIKIERETIFLITIYDKSEIEDISSKELLSILKETGLL